MTEALLRWRGQRLAWAGRDRSGLAQKVFVMGPSG